LGTRKDSDSDPVIIDEVIGNVPDIDSDMEPSGMDEYGYNGLSTVKREYAGKGEEEDGAISNLAAKTETDVLA
jgi:hypothetical protein